MLTVATFLLAALCFAVIDGIAWIIAVENIITHIVPSTAKWLPGTALDTVASGGGEGISYAHGLIVAAVGRVPDLHQAEVEYIRSRVITGRPGDDLMDEFGQLCDWTRQFLDGCGVNAEQDNLSKLTWLRQAAHDRPPQQPLSTRGQQVARPASRTPPCCGGTCL